MSIATKIGGNDPSTRYGRYNDLQKQNGDY